jgi:hypothetical protein
MDVGKIVTWLAVGVGAYYLYEWWTGQTTSAATVAAIPTLAQYQAAGLSLAQAQGALALGLTVPAAVAAYTPAPVVASTAVSTPVAATTATSGPSSLDALYNAIVAAAAPDTNQVNGAMSGDHWNYYAQQITGKSLPVNYPSGNLTAAQYWAAVSSQIGTITGLSGLGGLGIFGGLGALVSRQRGWN